MPRIRIVLKCVAFAAVIALLPALVPSSGPSGGPYVSALDGQPADQQGGGELTVRLRRRCPHDVTGARMLEVDHVLPPRVRVHAPGRPGMEA